MDFLNKLGKKASETAKGVGEKTSKLTREAKLRMKMNDNKMKINEVYKQIGKKVYEKHTTNEEINIKVDLEEECTKIDVLSAEIETSLKEIQALNDQKQCVKCSAIIAIDAKFCTNCGAEQPAETAEVKIAEVESTKEESEEQPTTEIAENVNEVTTHNDEQSNQTEQ